MNTYHSMRLHELNDIRKELRKMHLNASLVKIAGFATVALSFILMAAAAENQAPASLAMSPWTHLMLGTIGIVAIIGGVATVTISGRKTRILRKRLSEIAREIATRKQS